LTVSKGIRPVSVPNIIGLTKSAAISALLSGKLGFEIIGSTQCNNGYKKNTRKVSQQSVIAGSKVAPGTVVGFVITAVCKR
jgi:beta-lactam-binding protein with PASTA domain